VVCHKPYVADDKWLIQRPECSDGIQGEIKNGGYSHDVIENTCRKNVILSRPHDVYEKKGVSSSCRLKTGRGVYVQDRWCPHGRLIFLRRARREQLDVAPLQVGARNDSNVEAEGEKSRGGTSNPKRC